MRHVSVAASLLAIGLGFLWIDEMHAQDLTELRPLLQYAPETQLARQPPFPSGSIHWRKEDLILRGAVALAAGIPSIGYGIYFVRAFGCADEGEEFGGIACAAVGSMGAALLIGGLVSTTAGTIWLIRGLRMDEHRTFRPRVGIDGRGNPRVSLRFHF